MTHGISYRHHVETAQQDRAEALARFGFLVIAGADRAVRSAATAVTHGVGSLVGRWQQYQTRRATSRELAKLDDRLLRDIGLSRGDIDRLPDDLIRDRSWVETVTPAPVPARVSTPNLKLAA
ncbi:MAG TPA: DUF1127 domain-containing protein [Dongiaceae bacterium]|jgi:uncharacterized protein YjiS (DUF1127 family)